MARTCPKCNVQPLKKHRRYCDDCRDGVVVSKAVAAPPPARKVVVIPALQKIEPRAVDLSCGDTLEGSTLWQEQDTTCKKHGAVWVARVSR